MMNIYTRQFGVRLMAVILLLGFLGSGCSTKRYLKTDETLLRKNDIVLESDKRIKNKRSLKYELSTIIKQQPNERFLWLFKTRLWAYYKTQEKIQSRGDTSKWNKWVLRVIAEPPSLYSKKRTEATAQSMQYYLQHKGYNDAIVKDTAIHYLKRKKTYVTYTAYLNNQYRIDTVIYSSADTAIHRLMHQHLDGSFLKKGKAVSKSTFDKENDRYVNLLQNSGYAFFNNSFFYAEGDTTNYQTRVYYEILIPSDAPRHTAYRVGKITVIPDYTPNKDDPHLDTLINGVTFLKREAQMKVKAKNIINNIFLKTGELYQADNLVKTNLQLGDLEIFKRVNIQRFINDDNDELLDFVIRLTPKKRMVFGADLEVNNSTYNATETSLIGLAGSLNFRHRNLFRNAFLFMAELQGGVDLDIRNPDNLLYSVDLTAQTNLYMPRFVDPLGLWKGLRSTRLLNKRFYQDLKEKGRTRLSGSYNRVSLFQYYGYNAFNFSYGYDLQRSAQNRYQVNQFGVNYFQIDNIEPAFKEVLDNNPFLANSFDDQLFTGLFFRDLTYTHVSRTNKFGESFFFQGYFELSGAEVWSANALYNRLNNNIPKDTFKLFNNVEFSQFASLLLDFRYYKTVNSSQSLAVRFQTGIARPFGFSDEVPYVKQFFAGGPTSIRAWRIRELGPGQYINDDTLLTNNNIPFYQTADFKLEFSAEYRFDLFWMLESAIFLDVGNVWSIREDPNRPGAQLLWNTKFDGDGNEIGKNLFEQLAIGTGFGLRGDFTYFIIRLDMGIKLRNPYPDVNNGGGHWRWQELRRPLRGLNYNLAIGYPF